jgi:hypothetical protein
MPVPPGPDLPEPGLFVPEFSGHLDAGYWILDTRCWMLDAGCWMLDFGFWILCFYQVSSIGILILASIVPSETDEFEF